MPSSGEYTKTTGHVGCANVQKVITERPVAVSLAFAAGRSTVLTADHLASAFRDTTARTLLRRARVARMQQELPPMTVSVHAYSIRPADRMVGINNRMLREGPDERFEVLVERGQRVSRCAGRLRAPRRDLVADATRLSRRRLRIERAVVHRLRQHVHLLHRERRRLHAGIGFDDDRLQ